MFSLQVVVSFLLMSSSSLLLILPISDLHGFMSLQVGLLLKLALWSFRVMNAFRSASLSTLSSIFSDFAIALSVIAIFSLVSALVFL